MKPKLHVVITTINHPNVILDIAANATTHNRLADAKVWIVGDVKTPASTADLAKQATDSGLQTIYLDIEAQHKLGAEFGPFYDRLPLNNESRRNIGYLAALADGCEILLSIDDDNFPTASDFIGGHLQAGIGWHKPLLCEQKGFHNICEYLEFEPARPVYARGFPFRLRGTQNLAAEITPDSARKIGVLAGLWLQDPDIDAITWLNGAVRGTAYHGPDMIALDQSTWTPINTQNTSVVRALVPAYLCVPMGWDVPGGKIQRYGDIWGGYFLQALMQGTEYNVAFGEPIAEHRRNPHDYLDDLRGEYWGLLLTDWLLNLLKNEFRPKSSSIFERLYELSEFLKKITQDKLPAWCPAQVRDFLLHTATTLELWSDSCRKVM